MREGGQNTSDMREHSVCYEAFPEFLQVQHFLPFPPLEVLHLVEFYLEDGITDEEAVALIDLEAPRVSKRENKWQEMMTDRILLIRIGFLLLGKI